MGYVLAKGRNGSRVSQRQPVGLGLAFGHAVGTVGIEIGQFIGFAFEYAVAFEQRVGFAVRAAGRAVRVTISIGKLDAERECQRQLGEKHGQRRYAHRFHAAIQ